MKSSLVLLVALAACRATSNAVDCGNGRICAPGTVCETEHGLCLAPQQIGACAAEDDGKDCVLPNGNTGTCFDTLCIESTWAPVFAPFTPAVYRSVAVRADLVLIAGDAVVNQASPEIVIGLVRTP